MTNAFSCNFLGCETKNLAPETALVPSIKAIRQAEDGRRVTPEILAKHAFCKDHAALGRAQAGRMFSYLETVRQLEQHAAQLAKDRATASQVFAKYGGVPKKTSAPGKPTAPSSPRRPSPRSDAMKNAFVNAGIVNAASA